MKNGAPMNDNTIPTGISEGMAITLDIKSQSTIKSAPRSADVGIRYGIWSPTRSLARCGTIIPINPIIQILPPPSHRESTLTSHSSNLYLT